MAKVAAAPEPAWGEEHEPRVQISTATLTNAGKAGKQNTIERTISKVQARESVPEEQEVDPSVEVFIKGKLREWDRDRSGHFSVDETKRAMQELRATTKAMANLKWQVAGGFVVLMFALLLVLGALSIGLAVAKSTGVSRSGQLEKPGSSVPIVTTEHEAVGDMPSVLNFDSTTDAYAISDAGLRGLAAVSFIAENGTFFQMEVAELRRFDSGPAGSTDQLDIIGIAGHHLRITEGQDGLSELEVRWRGSTQWVPAESARRLVADEEASEAGPEAEAPEPPAAAGVPEAPARLLAKGHYVGGVFVTSRNGHYRCDPNYIDNYHDPDYYCDNAWRSGGPIWLMLLTFGIALVFGEG
mmetsp:Transcript_48400/g.149698  ORF Transcript_48400/g.149698 Transcript_48400/m.149698 type:complete len:355 (+) Transcript_48400:316-1380(+)